MMPDPMLAFLQTSPGIALIVAAVVYVLQQVVSAVKSLTKLTPEQRLEKNNEKLSEALTELGANLKMLNEISHLRHTQILHEVQSIRSKLP